MAGATRSKRRALQHWLLVWWEKSILPFYFFSNSGHGHLWSCSCAFCARFFLQQTQSFCFLYATVFLFPISLADWFRHVDSFKHFLWTVVMTTGRITFLRPVVMTTGRTARSCTRFSDQNVYMTSRSMWKYTIRHVRLARRTVDEHARSLDLETRSIPDVVYSYRLVNSISLAKLDRLFFIEWIPSNRYTRFSPSF